MLPPAALTQLADDRASAQRGNDAPPRRARAGTRSLAPPLLAFALAQAALYGAARASGYPYFRYLTWHRFDSGFYVHSATWGYDFVRCRAPLHGWCGRAGWFPGYSIMIAALHALGPTPRQAALTLSLLFCAGSLLVLWIGLLDSQPTPRNVLALGFAAFVPGQIYDHSVFPLSMASFFVLLAFALLRRRRHAAAGVAGAVACMTYPTAVLLAPVTAAWLLIGPAATPLRTRIRRAASTGGLMALGLGAVLVIDKLEVGAWTAYFKVQAHYQHTARDPLTAWVDNVGQLGRGSGWVRSAPHLEAAFVGGLVIALAIDAAIRRWQRADLHRIELLALMLAAAVWLFPLSLGSVDVYRSDALLIPAALLVRRLPLALACVAVAAAVALSVPMAQAFFDRVLG